MTAFADLPNIGALHGALLIEALARHGVTHAVMSPGSRSSPLVAALAAHDGIDVTIRVDERGAAFHALGLARGSGRPAVVVTTSGTAVANLLPAVVEASMDRIPLILLTADRPPELHDVGANQAIPQRGIFGAYVRHAASLPVPDATYRPADTLAEASAAFAAATGRHPGPVHLNCPLREPLAPMDEAWDRGVLEPIAAWMAGDAPFAASPDRGAPVPDLAAIQAVVAGARRGVLVLGTLDAADRPAVEALVRATGFAVFADIRSGFRHGARVSGLAPFLDRVFAYTDPDAVPRPDVILQLGGRLVSKRMHALFQSGAHDAYVLVDDAAPKSDPTHGVTHHVLHPPGAVAAALAAALDADPTRVPDAWTTADAAVARHLDAAFARPLALEEPLVARHIAHTIPGDHALFLSSSMPIRDVQDHAAPGGAGVPLAANRGASGIDGVVSTALGFAEGTGRPTTLLIGDLALLHDLNALGSLSYASQPLTIVVVNNHGGGIFAFLPIADHPALFDPYFETPHKLTFAHIANAFGLRYFPASTPAELEDGYRTALAFGDPALIEVASGVHENRKAHAALEDAIRRTLAAPGVPGS